MSFTVRPTRTEAQSDLDHGQVVIIAARWVLIAVGLFLLIVKPAGDVAALRVQIGLVLLLGLGNFAMHAQLLKRRPVAPPLALAAGAIDLVVISALLASQGADSQVYVLYFPALLALSVAFEPIVTMIYAAATALVYSAIAGAAPAPGDSSAVIMTRVVMLAGVAFCGAAYWHVERDRRRRNEPARAETTTIDEGSAP
jgi:hypothetical protein